MIFGKLYHSKEKFHFFFFSLSLLSRSRRDDHGTFSTGTEKGMKEKRSSNRFEEEELGGTHPTYYTNK